LDLTYQCRRVLATGQVDFQHRHTEYSNREVGNKEAVAMFRQTDIALIANILKTRYSSEFRRD
jgi:hypothetical protein